MFAALVEEPLHGGGNVVGLEGLVGWEVEKGFAEGLVEVFRRSGRRDHIHAHLGEPHRRCPPDMPQRETEETEKGSEPATFLLWSSCVWTGDWNGITLKGAYARRLG